jgi:hypothetical protein
MTLEITIVEVPHGQGAWKALYATFLSPTKAVQQWHERRDLRSLSAVLDPTSGFIESPLVRAWTVRVPATPKKRPWIVRALRRVARASASTLHLVLFGPLRRPDARVRGRLGAR